MSFSAETMFPDAYVLLPIPISDDIIAIAYFITLEYLYTFWRDR